MTRALASRKTESRPSGSHNLPSSLKVSHPGDTCEQEADRVAGDVTSGEPVHGWSIANVGVGRVQRQTPGGSGSQQPQQPKPSNYAEGGAKLAEAFIQTDTGKKILQAVTDDPLVRAGEAFLASLPGKIITGAAAAGTVAALAAEHKALPIQIPAIPLGKISPKLEGASVKITYEGPVDKPTQAMITFSYTPGGGKKKKESETDRNRAETARVARDQDQFRAGMTYQPGTPEAAQQQADQKMFDDYALHRIGTPLPGTGGIPLGEASAGPLGAGFGATEQRDSGLKLPTFESRFKPKTPTLLDQKLELKPIDAAPPISGDKDKKEETPVQRKGDGSAAVLDPAALDTGLHSASRPLDRETQRFMESRIGYDFSKVKIHTDDRAAASAKAMGALAYTVGDSVVFGAGHYNPQSTEGRRLLAHELTHVVQQAGSAAPCLSQRLSQPLEPVEREADGVAGKVSSDTPRVRPRGGVPVVMRQTPPVIKPGTPGFRGARATAGEQGMAFSGYRAEDGWVFLDGPSGSAGHAWNQPGFDGAAFRPKGKFEMHILDNKSWASPGEINSASALSRNLVKNLDVLIQAAADTKLNGLEGINAARAALANARSAVAAGQPLPSNVKLVVTNFGGRSPGITASLRAKGVIFRNLATSPRAAVASKSASPTTAASGGTGSAARSAGGSASGPTADVTGTGRGASSATPSGEGNVTVPAADEGAAAGAIKGAAGEGNSAASRAAGDVGVMEAPKVTMPETGGVVPVEEASVGGGSLAATVAGITLSIVIDLAISLAIGLILNWFKNKAEQAALERDIHKLTPQIEARIKQEEQKIVELQKKGKVYARITFDILRREGWASPPEAQGNILTWDNYNGVSLGDVEVVGEDKGNSHAERDEPGLQVPGQYSETKHHDLETVTTLLDDPQKRLREKQDAEAKEKLRRDAARHPAPPPPLTQKSIPLLPGPGPKDQDPNVDFLPGSPGVSPIRAAESMVGKYKELAVDLIVRGNKLLSSSPSQADINAFKHDEEMWRAAATLTKNHYIREGPDVGATGMDEVLNSDQYGGRLKEIRNNFGG